MGHAELNCDGDIPLLIVFFLVLFCKKIMITNQLLVSGLYLRELWGTFKYRFWAWCNSKIALWKKTLQFLCSNCKRPRNRRWNNLVLDLLHIPYQVLSWGQNESSSLSLSSCFLVVSTDLSLVGFSEKLLTFFPNRFPLPVDVASFLFACFGFGSSLYFPLLVQRGISSYFPPFIKYPSFIYRWAAEGFTKRARWLPPRRRRRRRRVAIDASWATSLTVPCSGSPSASRPSSSKQLRPRPVSTSPSEQNCRPWGTKGCAVLSRHWERKQKVHSCDKGHEGKWSTLLQH